MTRLEIEWPDEGAERVRAAKGRLLATGPWLRSLSLEERLARVTRILRLWTEPDSPWRRELTLALAETTPFERGTISEGLESGLRAWNPEDFAACARHELQSANRRLSAYSWTTVLAGGSIPMPTILSSLIPLVTGSPVLLRETSKDRVTANLLARSIAGVDAELGACFESIFFPSSDTTALDESLTAPCVVATGSDATIQSVAARLRPSQRFVTYGHRFSIAVLGKNVTSSPDRMTRVAQGLALDIARWDQSGCLSPVIAYLVDLPSSESKKLSTEIYEALDRLSADMPRGKVSAHTLAEIATERSLARMRAASGNGMLFEGTTHTVVLESDATPRPAPLNRFFRLMPVESLSELNQALKPFSDQISTVSIEGFGSEKLSGPDKNRPDSELTRCLSALGVSRITLPGALQTPPVDWPHDGQPLFLPVARFISLD